MASTIKITLTIEADLMRDAHEAVDAMDAKLRARGGRVVSGKLVPPDRAAQAAWVPTAGGAMRKWTVLYTRIPTSYNPQCKLVVEAVSAEDAYKVAQEHIGDRGKTLSTYHIEDVKPFEPLAVAGRVIGGGS